MASGKLSSKVGKMLGWNSLVGLSFLSALVAALIAVSDISKPDNLESAFSWILVTLIFVASLLVFAFARLQIAWRDATKLAVGDRSKTSGNFHEQFGYLVAALSVLCIVAFENGINSSLWPWEVDFTQPWQIVLFCIALLAAFCPLLFALQRHDQLLRDSAFLDKIESDHISDGSIWISVFVAFLLICLAWSASKKLIDLDGWYGPAVMGIVVTLFLFFIFLPSFVRLRLRNHGNKGMVAAGLAISAGKVASMIDAWFATRFAPLTGATQTGAIPPHLILLSVFLPLTVMGYALSDGWGLLPIGVAFLLAVSLGRRWAWVESDRETAMRIQKTRGRGIKIGFRNDLRDEALLGYAFLFLLVPLALRQIQMIATPFEIESAATLTDWAAFFGTELAKAVPIVDWADIYGLQSDANAAIKAEKETAQHLVFFSRIMVDAIIIAALLQAWSIMQRNKSQRQLFNSGQLDLLDPFAEAALFKREVVKREGKYELSSNLKKTFENRVKAAKELHLRAGPYNSQRLNELVHDERPEMKAVADYLVQEYSLLAGSSRERILQLENRWVTAAEKKWQSRSWVRDQRLTFENLMDEAQDGENSWQITLVEESCRNLANILSLIASRQEFVNGKRAAFELLGERSTLYAVAVLAGRLFDVEGRYSAPDFVCKALRTDGSSWHFKREPLQDRRVEVLTALGRIAHDHDGNAAAPRLARSILEWFVNPDNEERTKKLTRNAAKTVLEERPVAPLF